MTDKRITEILPDNMPEWANEALESGQFFRECLKKVGIMASEINRLEEQIECAHMWLDDKETPRKDEKNGCEWSIVGRVKIYIEKLGIAQPHHDPEELKLIKNWDELAQVEDSETHKLEIDEINGRLCSGWIVNKKTGDQEIYLSTHTFYGLNFENSTKVLQEHGFNVEIDNWDKNEEKNQ